MLRVGFEPTISMFEWAKIFRVLDCTATRTSMGKTATKMNMESLWIGIYEQKLRKKFPQNNGKYSITYVGEM
jgi:hypothetical protein